MIRDLGYIPVFNSRGDRTIKVWITTDKGTFFATAPSGKSRGKYEAKTLDVGKVSKIFSKVKKEVVNTNENNPEIVDERLMKLGGKDLGKIGANLAIAISMARMRAATLNKVYKFNDNYEFPYPLGNVVGGGSHGGYTSIQEFLVIPAKAKTIAEAVETNIKIWKEIGESLKRKGMNLGRNDEGAWVARMNDLKTLDMVCDVADRHDAIVGIDMASSQFYKNGKYFYGGLGKKFDSDGQLDFVSHLIKTYRLSYVEDPFHENDFLSFSQLRKRAKCIIVGDDLFATNQERIIKGAKKNAGNGIIIKPDQNGTILGTLETVDIAQENGYKIIVSHRSGETEDAFISDFAVAVGADLIKCGVSGGERVAKANRLIEIWSAVKGSSMKKLKF